MTEERYIACTRMYNAAGAVTTAWQRLVKETALVSGVPLRFDHFSFPKDIMHLWDRPDLGCAFICGRPFALGGFKHKPVAVPLRASTGGTPCYATKLLVRADSPFHCLEDTFGLRLGLTTPHSLSGFFAVREHLAPYQSGSKYPLYAEEITNLHTPANCLKALAENRVAVAPLDGYYHELLERHTPGMLAHTRVIAETRQYPMPLLVASPQTDGRVCEALREGLFTAARRPGMQPVMETLGLTGFGIPDVAAYGSLGATL